MPIFAESDLSLSISAVVGVAVFGLEVLAMIIAAVWTVGSVKAAADRLEIAVQIGNEARQRDKDELLRLITELGRRLDAMDDRQDRHENRTSHHFGVSPTKEDGDGGG